MNKKTLRIAEEILRTAEDLIFADADYIYDPDHKKKPGGGYHKTEKGWSKKEEKKDKSTSSPKVEMTDEQKKLDEYVTKEINEYKPDSKGTFTIYENLWNIANNPKTHLSTLWKLSDFPDSATRKKVAGNENCSVELLDKLSNDKDENVVGYVARNPKTPASILEKISNDVGYETDIASHPNATPELLHKLVEKELPDWKTLDTCTNVAENSNISEDTLKLVSEKLDNLANNYTPNERFYYENIEYAKGLVAKNPKTSYDIIVKLSNDKSKYVRKIADRRIEKNFSNVGIDLTKLSPELREKVKEWDAEDIAKFIGWLKEHKG